MEINWSIFGWITAIIVLYLVGVYEGRGTGYKKRKREEEQEKMAQPVPTPIPVDDPGVLRIKIENGSPILDLDGARANTSDLSPDQKKRLTDLLTMIHGWLGDILMPAPQIEKHPPLFTHPSAPVQPAATPPPPIGITRPAVPNQPIAAKEDRPLPPATSIVGQIDSILQARMVGTPLAERRIFLAESPEGGVMVNVGVTKYPGIDDVPDHDIKTAIRAAIAEWEKKYTPGL